MTPHPVHPRSWLGRLAPDHLGLVGQTSTSWGVAGGLLAALVVCGHVLAGSLSSSVGFVTATLLFLAGAAVGFVHGALLAWLGRPEGVTRGQAAARLALGLLYALPELLVGWVVAMLLVLSAFTLTAGRYLAFAATLIGWAAAFAILGWAAVETRRTLHNLLVRWPDARAVLLTLAVVFAALVPLFVLARPEIWVLDVRPTPTAAFFMALAATLWIAGPLVVVGDLALRSWQHRSILRAPAQETSHDDAPIR